MEEDLVTEVLKVWEPTEHSLETGS
jgi:hypothetical protein